LRFRISIIFIFLLLCSGSSFAQHVLSRNFSLKEGLPSSETYHVITDHSGFIWVSSDAGLCRFDGYSFHTFSIKDGLPETTLFNLYEDPKGRIWFTTLNSNIGYVQGDSVVVLKKFREYLSEGGKSVPFVASLLVDSGDTLWVGTSGTGRLIKMAPPYFASKPVIVLDKTDFLIHFGETESVWGLYWKTKPHDQLVEGVKNKSGLSLTERTLDFPDSSTTKFVVAHPKGFLVCVNNNKIYKVEGNKSRLIKTLKRAAIGISVDQRGCVWVSESSQGIHCFPDLVTSDHSIHLFGETNVSSAVMDFEGCYWFTTLERGLLYMPRLDFTVIGPDEGLVQKRINSVVVLSPDRIMAQSYSGNLYLFNRGEVTVLPTLGLSVYESPSYPGKIFYTGNFPGCFNLSDLKLHPILQADKTKWYINHYASGPGGKLYASYTNNLLSIDEHLEIHPFLALNERINSFFVDKMGVFWIGTMKGLVRYNGIDPPEHLSKLNDLLSKRIDMISEDRSGRLWLATRGNGLLVFDKIKGVTVIDKHSGLPSDFCRTLCVDSDNTVWVGTNAGLSSIRGTSLQVINYALLNDLSSGEINDIKRTGNYLWVACSEGVFRYAIDQLESLRQDPPIFITGVSSSRKARVEDNAVLAYDDNFIKISFLGLSYYEAGKLSYAYKLDGADKEWRHTNNLAVEYPTLPSGSYCFTVKPDVGIQSSPHFAQFKFTIKPPFWKTIGFIGTLSFFVTACIILLFISSVNRIKRKAKARINIANLEATALRAQMNPHFIFNAINSIQNFILKNEKKPAHDFLTKFSRLIRNVLEFSKSDFITLRDEIQTLDLYIQLEKLRASDKFEYQIKTDPDISPHILLPSMVLQPFIENAVIHGLLPKVDGPGQLNITFNKVDNRLRCRIEDNGIGRKKAGEIKEKKQNYHRPMGLSVTSERLDILRKINHFDASCITEDLFDDQGAPLGTRVTLLFPLTYKQPHK
jgi:ligand-binding sensor domain-containing protein